MAVFSPTGSLMQLHENRIEEVINKNVEVFLPGLSRLVKALDLLMH